MDLEAALPDEAMRLGWVDGQRDEWIVLVKHVPTAARLHDLVLCLAMCTSVDWMSKTWRPFRTALTAAGRATSKAWKAHIAHRPSRFVSRCAISALYLFTILLARKSQDAYRTSTFP